MSEFVGDIAATAVKGVVATATGGLLSAALPWLAGAAALVALAGAGGTIWYRMQWEECKAAGAQALAEQRDIDRRDNSKAVGALNQALAKNEGKYESSIAILNSIPRSNACARSDAVSLVRQQLCAQFPASPSCSGQQPPIQVPGPGTVVK